MEASLSILSKSGSTDRCGSRLAGMVREGTATISINPANLET